MTISELAKILNISYQAVWRMMERKNMLAKTDVVHKKDSIKLERNDVWKLLCYLRIDPVENETERLHQVFRYAMSLDSDWE